MTFTTRTPLLASMGIALCLVLAACAAPAAESSAGDGPATEESAGAEQVETASPADSEGAACSDELDQVVSAGLSFERLTAAEYTVASIAPEVLAAGCVYQFETSGKTGQWAWLPGAMTADVTDALVAAGYTLVDTFDNALRYESADGVGVTVITAQSGELEDSGGVDPVFTVIGPYVGIYADFN